MGDLEEAKRLMGEIQVLLQPAKLGIELKDEETFLTVNAIDAYHKSIDTMSVLEKMEERDEKCPTCDGSGKVPYPWSYTDWDTEMPCPDCVGKNIWNASEEPVLCPTCNGSGFIPETGAGCPSCTGRGITRPADEPDTHFDRDVAMQELEKDIRENPLPPDEPVETRVLKPIPTREPRTREQQLSQDLEPEKEVWRCDHCHRTRLDMAEIACRFCGGMVWVRHQLEEPEKKEEK